MNYLRKIAPPHTHAMRPRADRQYLLLRETVRKDYAGATVAFKAVTRLAPDDATAWYRLAALEVRRARRRP